MVRWIIRILVQAAVLALIALLLPTWLSLSGAREAILAVALVSVLSVLVRPLLFVLRILTLPLSCLTLGLFSLALSFGANVFILWLVDRLLEGITIHRLWPLMGIALLLGVSGTLVGHLTMPSRPR
jgi:putative membrane protein